MSDYVRIYQERFWTLWNLLKKFLYSKSCKSCNRDCRQGRKCDCGPGKNLEIRKSSKK